MASLSDIRIVLVEPAGALNVGSVARIMKNMGLAQLVLVNPRCDPLGNEARLLAVHAAEILEMAQIVPNLSQALSGCQHILATVGRTVATTRPIATPRQALPKLVHQTAAIIFGREDRGLTNQELTLAHELVAIPTHSAYPSLNLAQAVGVCCYELWQSQAEPFVHAGELANPDLSPAGFEDLEGFYGQWQSLLLDIGYLLPHTAHRRMAKLRGLVNRGQPTANEIALLRGMIRQIQWALSQSAAGHNSEET